ncbi:MAG: signal peptidase II [Pseudobacteriovorax sp.]|nr:signal peptidase II [Pseudobacteriovorax sp.]
MNLKSITFPFLSNPLGKIMSVLLCLVFFGSVGLDQVSKQHAQNTLLKWESPDNIKKFRSSSYDVFHIGDERKIDGFFSLRFNYQRNTGAAFSMLADWDDRYRIPFFYAVTVIAVIFISFYLKTLPLNYNLTRLGLVLMLSGAIGNFLDRVNIGYVIDFLDTEWRIFGWYVDFAVFNIADVAINLGIIFFILEAITRKKPMEVKFDGSRVTTAKST